MPGIDSPGNSFFGGTPVFYNGNELTIPIININKGFNDKNKYRINNKINRGREVKGNNWNPLIQNKGIIPNKIKSNTK